MLQHHPFFETLYPINLRVGALDVRLRQSALGEPVEWDDHGSKRFCNSASLTDTPPQGRQQPQTHGGPGQIGHASDSLPLARMMRVLVFA
jgi:hypothetical protein